MTSYPDCYNAYYGPTRYEDQYLQLLEDILENGEQRGDRTGTGTLSLFGRQLRYSANEPFPLLTTKKVYTKSIIHELIWFISGSSNIRYLLDNNVHIWDEWTPAYKTGVDPSLVDHTELDQHMLELNRVYGAQWRSWHGSDRGQLGEVRQYDQLARVISDLKTNPNSRRHIVSAWKVDEVDHMGLPPCHVMFQFYVRKGKYLDCHMYQRSADVFLGVPFNMASYALLTAMIAQVVGLEPGEVIHSFGDVHIYNNHIDQVKEQLSREIVADKPVLVLDKSITSIDDFTFDSVRIDNYKPLAPISAPISV